MDRNFKEAIWRQFGASIDMLENAIALCPVKLWDTESKFWYNAYHCLFWLDYYLTLDPVNFKPPTPYTLSEFDSNGAMPDRTYTKEELISYLQHGRKKCYDLISILTNDIANSRWINAHKNYTVFEIFIYIRHTHKVFTCTR